MKPKMNRMAPFWILIWLLGLGMAQHLAQARYVIGVNGLTCPFCSYGLQKKLKKVEGVESVCINLEKGEAVVTAKADANVEEESLRKAVRGAGFSVASLRKLKPEEQVECPGAGREKGDGGGR